MKNPKLGATHDDPHGKLNADDEGGLRIAIAHTPGPGERLVRIDFGKKVAWLAMPREQACEFAVSILKHAGVGVELKSWKEAEDASDLERRGQSDSQVES